MWVLNREITNLTKPYHYLETYFSKLKSNMTVDAQAVIMTLWHK